MHGKTHVTRKSGLNMEVCNRCAGDVESLISISPRGSDDMRQT